MLNSSYELAKQVRARLEKPGISRKAIERELKATPSGRPRTSGPVGPETDWSLRLSRIWHDEYKQNGLTLDVMHGRPTTQAMRRIMSQDPCPIREKVAIHHYLSVLYTSDEGCRRWTDFAMKYGAHYDGEYAYRFPGRRSKDKLAKVAFDHFKREGLVPSGRRSQEARIRRGAARRERQAISRVRRGPPLEVPEPLVVRPSRSARTLRSSWRRCPERVTWSAYRQSQVVEPVLCLWPTHCRLSVSKPVLDALSKIYSRKEYYDPNILEFGKEHLRAQKPPQFKWRKEEPVEVPTVPFKVHVHGPASRIVGSEGQLYLRVLGGQTTLIENT
jgi:hypothetical protein